MAKSKFIKRSIRVSGNTEYFASHVKKAAWSAIVESLALIIMGLLFAFWPDTMIRVIAYIIGVFFILKGIYSAAIYYSEKGQNDFFNNDLLFATIFILMGIVSLVLGENIAGIFRVIIGIIIIYESLVRVNAAMKLSSVGVPSWKYTLILALMMMALGIFVTFYTGAVITLIGGLMIATGVIGIVGDIMFAKHVNTVVDKFAKIREGEVVKDK